MDFFLVKVQNYLSQYQNSQISNSVGAYETTAFMGRGFSKKKIKVQMFNKVWSNGMQGKFTVNLHREVIKLSYSSV